MKVGVSIKNEIIGVLVKRIIHGILASTIVRVIMHVKLINIWILKIALAKNVYLVN